MRALPALRAVAFDSAAEKAKPNLGVVYTPSALADWAASVLAENLNTCRSAIICDPACGDGELLRAAQKHFSNSTFLGIDINAQAVDKAAFSLCGDGIFWAADAVKMARKNGSAGWASSFCKNSIDAIIANPPWGADLFVSKGQLEKMDFELARGQFDSWSIFIEAGLVNLKVGGVAVFIIPDAIFLPEHSQVRKYIQNRTEIIMIARLGEGFFPGVCRGTAVLVVRNKKPLSIHKIEAFRLNRRDRADVFSGRKNLQQLRLEKSHRFPHSRFTKDRFGRWDIDSRASEDSRINAYAACYSDWTQWLHTGRGVELSKRGFVIRCPECGFARPESKKNFIMCAHCRYCGPSTSFRSECIVRESKTEKDMFPFVVGEDVGRYFAVPNRYIKKFVPGINYKTESVYTKRRLLVRKTGVGIKASIIDSPSMTNQVVFHYFENTSVKPPKFFMSYILGVLCSRTLLAYHVRTNGENEWRSHPYITQKIIAGLPVPLPSPGDRSWKQAKCIANWVDRALKNGSLSPVTDARIESMVAAMFGFDEHSFSWVWDVLSGAEALEPIRTLQFNDRSIVQPQWVG